MSLLPRNPQHDPCVLSPSIIVDGLVQVLRVSYQDSLQAPSEDTQSI